MKTAFHKINWYIEDYDGTKYLTLIPVDQKDIDALEEYKEILDKTKIPLKNKNSDDYGNKYLNIKINFDDYLLSEKKLLQCVTWLYVLEELFFIMKINTI